MVVKEFKAGVVTIPPLSSFEYALSFADVIHLQVDAETVTVASSFLSVIMMKNRQRFGKMTYIELTCKLFVQENYTSTDFFNDIVLQFKLPIKQTTFICNNPITPSNKWERLTREDFFESNTGARYPWAASKELHNFGKGTRVTYGALDYLKTLKIVESDDVYSKAFYLEFNKLRSLQIEQKELASDDWNHLMNWLSKIPSPDFVRFSIKTKSFARPELVHQLAGVIAKMTQQI